MRAARGEYIAWLDDDDLWLPAKTGIEVAMLEQYRDVVLVATDFSAFDAHGEIERSHIGTYYAAVGRSPAGVAGLYLSSDWLALADGSEAGPTSDRCARLYHGKVNAALAWGNFVHPPTIMFRRSLFERIGGLAEGLGNPSNEMEHEFFCARAGLAILRMWIESVITKSPQAWDRAPVCRS